MIYDTYAEYYSCYKRKLIGVKIDYSEGYIHLEHEILTIIEVRLILTTLTLEKILSNRSILLLSDVKAI